jgi:hypothetical protein
MIISSPCYNENAGQDIPLLQHKRRQAAKSGLRQFGKHDTADDFLSAGFDYFWFDYLASG